MSRKVFENYRMNQGIFLLISSALIFLAVYKAYSLSLDLLSIFVLILHIIIIGSLLTSLSLDDIKSFTVSSKKLIILFLYVLIVNLFFLVTGNPVLWDGIIFNPQDNIITGIIIFFIVFSIYYLSDKKAIGEADLILLPTAGLILGTEKGVYMLYITVYLAIGYSIIQLFRRKNLRAMKLPLFPIVVLSLFIVMAFYINLSSLVQVYFY